MTAPRGTLRLIPDENWAFNDSPLTPPPDGAKSFHAYGLAFDIPDADELGTFDTDNLWGFPSFAWRLPAVALAVGVAAGWIARGAR